MPSAGPRIAVLGGVPPSLGGGGLEVQLRETAAALRRRGLDVVHADREDVPRPFDLLHAFGAEPDVCQHLLHWRRSREAPLVVSPVLVVAPGGERRERLAASVPLASFGPRMRRDLLRRADLVVAQTEHERGMLAGLGVDGAALVPNGVTPVAATGTPDGTPSEAFVLLLGTVSARKRQADTVRALRGETVVVAGGFDGTPAERRDFEDAVAQTGATWLGEVTDAGAVRALLRDARALVHLSRAEGQALALLEALSEGTPVVVSRLPANEELAARHPDHVRIVDADDGLRAALASLPAGGEAPRPAIPRWDDVAERLHALYEDLLR